MPRRQPDLQDDPEFDRLSDDYSESDEEPADLVVALHSFVPSADSTTCLSFSKGTIIRVLSRDTSGWWDGEADGNRGWFPSNYVGPLPQSAQQSPRIQRMTSSLADLTISPTNVDFSPRNESSQAVSHSQPKSILDPVHHAIGLLTNACKANRVAHFQPATACIISSIRSVLSATDCLTRDSTVLRDHPMLMRERKFILSDLSQLVSQARKASSVQISEAAREHEIELMKGLAIGVLGNVENFVRVARDCGVDVPDRQRYEAKRDDNDSTPTPGSPRQSLRPSMSNNMLRSQSHGELLRSEGHRIPLVRSQTQEPTFASMSAVRPTPSRTSSSTVLPSANTSARNSSSATASTLSSQVILKVTNEYDQLLSLVAAFIGHIHTHSRSSHPSSCAHLIDMTRETVNKVRALLAIIESAVCNNPTMTNRPSNADSKEFSDLLSAREALYVVTTSLVTAARVMTSPPVEGENEDEEKQHLLQSATGVLRSAGECVTGMKLVLAGVDSVDVVFSPVLEDSVDDAAAPNAGDSESILSGGSATIVNSDTSANSDEQQGSGNPRRKHTLSYLGRKATSLNCLRERYAVDGEVEEVMREVMRENRLQNRSGGTEREAEKTASSQRTSVSSDESYGVVVSPRQGILKQPSKDSLREQSGLLVRRGVARQPDPLESTKLARGSGALTSPIRSRPRGSSISSIPEERTRNNSAPNSSLAYVSEEESSAPPTPVSPTGLAHIQTSHSALIAEFPQVPYQMPTPASSQTTSPVFQNAQASTAMTRSASNSVESALSMSRSESTNPTSARSSASSEERANAAGSPYTSPEMSFEDINPDKANAMYARKQSLPSQMPRPAPAKATGIPQSNLPRGLSAKTRPRAKTSPDDREGQATMMSPPPMPRMPSSEGREWFLRRDYQEGDIVLNTEDGTINRATFDALIIKLSMHDNITDATFIKTFFLTFRMFTTPKGLTAALIRRFNIQPPTERELNDDEKRMWQERKALPIRLRVYNNFKTWLETYWHVDQDREALDDIEAFAQGDMSANLNQAAVDRLSELIKKRRGEELDPVVRSLQKLQRRDNGLSAALKILKKSPSQERLHQIYTTGSATAVSPHDFGPQLPPTPNLTSKVISNLRAQQAAATGVTSPKTIPTVSVIDIHPQELARQLSIMENKLFRAILPEELASNEFEKAPGKSLAVHVKAVSALSTQITGWVSEVILSEKDTKKRINTLKHFIKTAKRCCELQNYASVFSILCALNSSTIFRLKKTWDGLQAKHRQTWDELSKKFTHLRNYGEYRKLVSHSSAPGVPFLGMWLSDLTFLAAGNRTYRPNPQRPGADFVNFDKFRRVYQLISEVQRFQSPYVLMEVPEIQAWLVRSLESIRASQDVNELYRQSCLLEPRAADDQKDGGNNSNMDDKRDDSSKLGDMFGWAPIGRSRNGSLSQPAPPVDFGAANAAFKSRLPARAQPTAT